MNNSNSRRKSNKWIGIIISIIFAAALTFSVKYMSSVIADQSETTEVTTQPGKDGDSKGNGGEDEGGNSDDGKDGKDGGGKDVDNPPVTTNDDAVIGTFNDHLYILCNGSYTEKQAEDYIIPGFHLATITSSEENVFIISLIDQAGTKSDGFWIGANDVDSEGVFKWVTGEDFDDFDDWPEGQPDNTDADTGGPENYLGIWREYHAWNDFAGDKKLGFILEKDSLEDNGESMYGVNEGRTYIVCNGEYTYREAEKKQLPGFHLVTTTSFDEYNYVMSLVNQLGDKAEGYWFGADDKKQEGTFEWCTGEKFDYDNWPEGQPDNSDADTGGSENYLGIWKGGIWNDFSGEQKFGFVLEKD